MTYDEIVDLINANLLDNTAGLITPQKHRQVAKEILDYIEDTGPTLLAEDVITSAQILSSNTTPVELIPAPGAGKLIWIESVGYINENGTAYATNVAGELGYADGPFLGGIEINLSEPNYVKQNSSLPATADPLQLTEILNKAFRFLTLAGDPDTGTFDIFYSIKYRIIDNPFA